MAKTNNNELIAYLKRVVVTTPDRTASKALEVNRVTVANLSFLPRIMPKSQNPKTKTQKSEPRISRIACEPRD